MCSVALTRPSLLPQSKRVPAKPVREHRLLGKQAPRSHRSAGSRRRRRAWSFPAVRRCVPATHSVRPPPDCSARLRAWVSRRPCLIRAARSLIGVASTMPYLSVCVARHFLDRDHAGVSVARELGHLPQRARAAVPDQVVRQDHAERLVADHRLRAQHRVAQAERFGLGHEHRSARLAAARCCTSCEQLVLAGFARASVRARRPCRNNRRPRACSGW